MTTRYVLVLVAPARRPWVADVARWATAGELAADAITCLSVAEVRAVLGAGRSVSAVLADAGTPGLDRDTVADATAAGAAVLVVDDGRHARDWESIGCVGLLPAQLSAEGLGDALGRCTRTVDPGHRRSARVTSLEGGGRSARSVVAVTGATPLPAALVAMALAQGLAARDLRVALIDGARRAPLTVLHDPGDVVPGLPELVDLCRQDAPDPDLVAQLLRPVPERGYELLLGLRRTRDWTLLRPRAVHAALDALERTCTAVVVHHDPDVDGEDTTGSVDVDERHAVARTCVQAADLVVVVDHGDLAGTQAASTVRADLADAGVPTDRVLTLLLTPHPSLAGRRRPLPRADQQSRVRALTTPRGLELVHRCVGPLPGRFVRRTTGAVVDVLDAVGVRERSSAAPRIAPGELGTRLTGEVA